MHGNVMEWCLDGVPGGAAAANYPAGAVVDPYVISGTQPARVGRTSSLSQPPTFLSRVALTLSIASRKVHARSVGSCC